MPKCSAAASMTSRAAPTTSGPMPSPGSSSMSNESRKSYPPRTPASTPATPDRRDQGVRKQLLGPLLVDHVVFLPERVRRASPGSPLRTPPARPRRAGAAGSGTTSDLRAPAGPPKPRTGETRAPRLSCDRCSSSGRPGPAGDRRRGGLRYELPEPRRGPDDLPREQEGVGQLVPDGQGQGGVWCAA